MVVNKKKAPVRKAKAPAGPTFQEVADLVNKSEAKMAQQLAAYSQVSAEQFRRIAALEDRLNVMDSRLERNVVAVEQVKATVVQELSQPSRNGQPS